MATLPRDIDIRDIWKGTAPRTKYSTPEQLSDAIGDYLNWAQELGEPLTLHGLRLYLGLYGKDALDEQADRGPAWREVVENARELIRWGYERALHRERTVPVGAIFALKNMEPDSWRDERKINWQGSLAKLDLTKLPDHLLERIARGEHPMSVLASAGQELPALPAPVVEAELLDDLPDEPALDPDSPR